MDFWVHVHLKAFIGVEFLNGTQNWGFKFESQQWLYLGMHASYGHGKILDLWEKQTILNNFKTFSRTALLKTGKLPLPSTNDGPGPPKSF